MQQAHVFHACAGDGPGPSREPRIAHPAHAGSSPNQPASATTVHLLSNFYFLLSPIQTFPHSNIRRGDYRNAFNGRYFYTDEQYADFLSRFARTQSRPVRFVLVSNEPVDSAPYRARALDVTIASGSPQEDVVALSRCDIVLGPPSTFSGFATYLGGIPRIELRSPTDCIKRDCCWRLLDDHPLP